MPIIRLPFRSQKLPAQPRFGKFFVFVPQMALALIFIFSLVLGSQSVRAQGDTTTYAWNVVRKSDGGVACLIQIKHEGKPTTEEIRLACGSALVTGLENGDYLLNPASTAVTSTPTVSATPTRTPVKHFWLETPATADEMKTNRPLAYLGGKLIAAGYVDVGWCNGTAFLENGYASSCGLTAARPYVFVWQNRFDATILKSAKEEGVPAFLLKNLLIQESQLWPAESNHIPPEYGIGQMTENGADTLLMWNLSYFKRVCRETLSREKCIGDYMSRNLTPADRAILRGVTIKKVRAECPTCAPLKMDIALAESSIPIFSATVKANYNQVNQMVKNMTGRFAFSQMEPQEIWKISVANYNGGPGCTSSAMSKTLGKGEPLRWKFVKEHFEDGCKNAIDYVEAIILDTGGEDFPPADQVDVATRDLLYSAPPAPAPTLTPIPTATATATVTATFTATATPTVSVTPTINATSPTLTGSETPVMETATPEISPTPTWTETAIPTFTSTPIPQPTAFAPPSSSEASEEIVVKFGGMVPGFMADSVIDSSGGEVQTQLDELGLTVVSAPEGQAEEVLSYLQDSSMVEYAEPNYMVQAFYTPNDPGFTNQTYLTDMQIPEAWDVAKGDGVIVAVIDTGVDVNHPDLANSIYINPGEDGLDANGNDKRTNYKDDDGDGYVDNWMGWNFADNNNDARDSNGHGTHIAGVIAAQMDNTEGMAGIAPNARIMVIKALDNFGFGSYSNVAQAIIYAVDHGAHVINLGFGGSANSEALLAATDYAYDHGVVVVAAGGNTGSLTTIYPAANPNVIAVGALNPDLSLATFSTVGNPYYLTAPGIGIYSTIPNGDYKSMSGTSMSAAQVSGVAALLRSQPQFNTAAKVHDAIFNSARDLGDPGADIFYGFGLVRALDALTGIKNPTGTPVPTATPNGTPVPGDGGTVSIMGDMAGSQITDYTRACTTPGYTALSNATMVPALGGNDLLSSAIPIGFDFWYMGTRYTQVYASSNGWLSFGSPAGSYNANDLDDSSSLSTAGRPFLAPLWDHLDGTGGTASYKTTGAVGSRTFTFEWSNWKWDENAAGAVISFQATLHEGTGIIDFNYHQNGTAVNNGSASIGITGTANSSFLSAADTGCSPTWSSATETDTLATKPADGVSYTFDPQSTAPVAPGGLNLTNVAKTSLTLNWTDNSTGEDGFGIYTSTDGTNYSYYGQAPADATNVSVSGLTDSANNYWKVHAVVEGSASPAASVNAPISLNFTNVTLTGMTLNWTDNSSNETGFYIFNSTDNDNFTQVTTTAADAVSFPATGLTTSTTYYWRVQAVADGTAETVISAAATGSKSTNTAPVVSISSPPNNFTFDRGQSITFTGTASDDEDGDLTPSLSWSSNIDGPFGSGNTFPYTRLTPGTHTITAQVTDSGGATDSATITVNIKGGFGPHGGMNGSTDGCAQCHRSHSALGPIELLAFSTSSKTSNVFCETCHDGVTARAVSTHSNLGVQNASPDAKRRFEGDFEVLCVQCHDPHGGTDNLFTVRKNVIFTLPDSTQNPTQTAFTALTGSESFDDGISDQSSRICVTCHIPANNPTGGSMTNHTGGGQHNGGYDYTGLSCITCHPHDADAQGATKDGFMPVRGACDSCHGAPPATGAHAAHSNPATLPTVYGKTGVNNSNSAYDFACGECHPTDVTKHLNGTVEVDLRQEEPFLPQSSLKYKNGKSVDGQAAGYNTTTGVCSNVYCHSGKSVTSGPVGSATGLDAYGNLTYASYTVTTSRDYQPTLDWNGTTSTNCSSCHESPLTTSYPTVEAGVGDSHQWVDDTGYGNLHAWNMGFSPLQCRVCHYDELSSTDWLTSRDAMDVTTYTPPANPLAKMTSHVNGQSDVVFAPSVTYNTVSQGNVTYTLQGVAEYRPAAVSCTNVGCHIKQKYVAWGSPYRYWTNECDLCHRYGSLPDPPDPYPTPLASMSINPGSSASEAASDTQHPVAIPAGKSCISCHTNVHR